MKPLFLRACDQEATERTPIWLMRQAGRYQPEYRALRAKLSFIEMCTKPEVAAEVTLLPVTQLGVDAAIIFADILLILGPLGIGFEFTKDGGPRIAEPIRDRAAIDNVAEKIDAAGALHYVMEAIKLVRRDLSPQVPLIGFAGAPFTLASYAIEGAGSREYAHVKRLMFSDKGAWDALMYKLTDAVIGYLNAQVQAGAQALQVFDSWVGCLSPHAYARYVQPHMERLFASIDRSVPTIHFGTGNPALYPLMKAAGGDVIGVDWRVDFGAQWDALGKTAIMGNLDPTALLAPREELLAQAQRVLDGANGRPGHIFNLGHGVLQTTEVSAAKALVDYVHEASAR
jgi:uroporphyrinogen decarboxylase